MNVSRTAISKSTTLPDRPISRRIPTSSRIVLCSIIGLYCLLRGPVMFRQLPNQDEDYFAVPGETILQDGIPRIPYMPSEDPDSAFYRADHVLYALPPLYFYAEAAVYFVAGSGTGNARLTSTLAGMAAVCMLYLLGRMWFQKESAALLGAGLYAFSRVVYFPCMIARPDMLCGFWGLAALCAATCWFDSRRRRWLVVSGVSIGLGLLTHPFALIFALQIGFWTLVSGRSIRERIANAAVLTVPAIATFALWVPLILLEPESFLRQFGNNVLHNSSDGLLMRLVYPVKSFAIQTQLFIEHTGPLQALFSAAALVIVTIWSVRAGDRRTWAFPLVVWGGLYLHVALQGTHPTKGYWCYTAAPTFSMAGYAISRIGDLWGNRAMALCTVAAFAALLPGSGLRTLGVHLSEWDNPDYNAPQFTARLIRELPDDGTYVVDPAYVFDFYRSGRRTLLALNYPPFFDVNGFQYDYLIGGPYSIRDGVPEDLDARYERTVGSPEEFFACYAKIYTAPEARRPQGEFEP